MGCCSAVASTNRICLLLFLPPGLRRRLGGRVRRRRQRHPQRAGRQDLPDLAAHARRALQQRDQAARKPRSLINPQPLPLFRSSMYVQFSP